MRETTYIAPEIEEEEALCITCEPTGAGLPLTYNETAPVVPVIASESRN